MGIIVLCQCCGHPHRSDNLLGHVECRTEIVQEGIAKSNEVGSISHVDR